jgi:hypothetical protein
MELIKLDWLFVDQEHIALVFDPAAFSAFGASARARRFETTEFLAEAFAGLVGRV